MIVLSRRMWLALIAVISVFIASPLSAAEAIRIATLQSGTVAWELETIKANGFDKKHGIEITIVPVAGKQSADVLLIGGEADVIVTDWIWVNRQRAAGQAFAFMPYSRQVGGVLVGKDSKAAGLVDLKGKSVGVAGGPLDKSWILLRGLAKKRYGFDLAEASSPVFAAPPLLSQKFQAGEIDAIITFWHFAAKLKAAGAREIATVADAAKELGLDPNTPLLGYVFPDAFAKAHPAAIKGLAAASRDAKALLNTDDAAWEKLRPMIEPKNDEELAALKAGFRGGIPGDAGINEKAVAAVLQELAKIGGNELVGDAKTLQPGVFYAE